MITKSRNVLLLGLGFGVGLSLGLASGVLADKPSAPGTDLPWQDARMLADVLERVKHDYVNPVDDHQLLQAAIRGMVSSLDPYSAYLDGDEYDEVKISSSGQYSGVGIEVSMEDEEVVVYRDPLSGFVAYVPKGSIAKGEALVKTGGGKTTPCGSCHGVTLQGLSEWPAIAGRHPNYIVRQLWNFQNGDRAGNSAALMKPVVAKLTTDDMLAIAAYVGSLKP